MLLAAPDAAVATHLDSCNQVLLNIISILDILEYGYHCICKGPWIKRNGDIPFASLYLRSPAEQKQLVRSELGRRCTSVSLATTHANEGFSSFWLQHGKQSQVSAGG